MLKDDTLNDFYRWLNLFLFRPSNVEPTSETIKEDFGSYSHLCREALAALRRAWAAVRNESEARLARDTWQSYLTVTYGKLSESDNTQHDEISGEDISEIDELFLRHTWLVSMSRLMVWAALSNGQTTGALRRVAQDVFSGSYFESKHLANLADQDFFHWIRSTKAESILASIWERVLDALLTYNLASIHEDVLKGVYQQLIDPKDRHDLGEYYTPDWLCERIVSEMLPAEGYPTVLDPSCGSGSFLRASIHHLLNNNTAGTPNDRLRKVLASVQGIDIHPVAVTIARATYVLALGKLVNAARRPIQIPVFLADSLFLPRQIEATLIETLSGIEITFGPRRKERTFVMPDMLIHQPENFDDAIAAATRVAEDHAHSGRETKETLERYLAQAVPLLSQLLERDAVVIALWDFVLGLSDLIRQKQNSIWSFIIRNSYRPAMMRQHFDFILGNPPWVAYRYVTDPNYQKEIKWLAVERYKIAPRQQKLFTQMELATVFLAHAIQTFARPGAKLAFVMPRSVLTADQHQNLICRTYSADFQLTGYWDLWDVVPLFNVPSCVLFAQQSARHGTDKDVIPAQIWTARLPGRDVPWNSVAEKFKVDRTDARVIWLGGRSALSTQAGAAAQRKSSTYAKSFKQGATIVPRNMYFVTVEGLQGKPDPDATYHAATDEVVAKDSKEPYQEVRLQGQVEGRFLFSTVLAGNILPFALRHPLTVALPLEESNGTYYTLTTAALRRKGFRELAKWMERAEKIWEEKRGAKASAQSLLERLDYQKGLTAQSPKHRHLVLYNAAGTNVSATYCDREALTLPLAVEHTVYWAALSTPDEAYYLSCVLNASVVNEIIKPFQSTGLLGERHIEKKLLDVPIPVFNHEDKLHIRLSALGKKAHEQAKAIVTGGVLPPSRSLARRRAFMRESLKEILTEINDAVRELLA